MWFDQSSYQYDNMKWDAATMVEFCKKKKMLICIESKNIIPVGSKAIRIKVVP